VDELNLSINRTSFLSNSVANSEHAVDNAQSNQPAALLSQCANTFFTPSLKHLAATRLIESLGSVQKTYEYIAHSPIMAQPLKATLDHLNLLASKAGYLILHGDAEGALNLCHSDPLILTCVVEEKDHQGRKVSGTLLQLAALADDCNARKKRRAESNHGLVEKLALLVGVDSTSQLKAVRPKDWKIKTNLRMQFYIDAACEFITALISVVVPSQASYEMVLQACQLPIANFKHALDNINIHQDVITTGLIFDTNVLVKVLKVLYKSMKLFKDAWREKTDLFMRIGFGSLQGCASVCDIQAFSKGLNRIQYNKALPDRTLHFAHGLPESLIHLGILFYLDSSGIQRLDSQKSSSFEYCLFKSYSKTKKTCMKKVTQSTDNCINRNCLTL